LLQNVLRQRERYFNKIENLSKELSSDTMPSKAFDFIKQERTISKKIEEARKHKQYCKDELLI
jgi:hypothetical protein